MPTVLTVSFLGHRVGWTMDLEVGEKIEDNHFLSPFMLFISFPEYDKLSLNSGLFHLLFLLPGVLLHMVSSSLSW